MNNLDESSTLKKVLDGVDNVRELLGGELTSKDRKFFEDTLSEIPQFIVTGAQSAGKSSVLSRLSGIKLPKKSKRCTRVAINLKLRREPNRKVEVTLNRPGGQCTFFNDESPALAIEAAQDTALSESGNAEFAEGYYVDVHVHGPTIPNVTLVDLPGFTNSSEADTRTVERIVNTYLNMKGSLVLHVGRGDSDYNSLLGNDIIRNYQSKVTNVFTYCDMLEKLGVEKAKETLEATVESTESPRFIVLGDLPGGDDSDEEREMLSYQCLASQHIHFELGVRKLQAHLERRIAQHMKGQIPGTIAKLRQFLDETQLKLNEISEKEPFEVINESTLLIRTRVSESTRTNVQRIRPLLDKMCSDLKKVRLKGKDANGDEFRDVFEKEVLENGTEVRYKYRDGKFGMGTVVRLIDMPSTKGVQCTHEVEIRNTINKVNVVPNDKLQIRETPMAAMVNEIIEYLQKERGLRNLSNADPQLVLDHYSHDYSVRYEAELNKYIYQFKILTDTRLQQVFDLQGVPLVGKNVMMELKKRTLVDCRKLIDNLQDWVHDAAQWNKSPLVFTTNEHNFNDIFTKLIQKSTAAATDEGSAEIFYFKVLSYLAVQTKAIIEACGKQFLLVFCVKVEEAIEKVLRSMDKWFLGLVKDPEDWKINREILSKRKQILVSGIEHLENVFVDMSCPPPDARIFSSL